MPVRPVKRMGKDGHYRTVGFMWGHHGKLYTIRRWGKEGAQEKAARQGMAVKISQTRQRINPKKRCPICHQLYWRTHTCQRIAAHRSEKKLYHGTDRLKGHFIQKKGLLPLNEIRKEADFAQGTSEKTNPDYVYLFDDPATAKIYARLVSERSEIPPQVLEVSVDEEKLEPDLELPHSFKMRGNIRPEKIKEIDIDKIHEEENKIDKLPLNEQRKWRRKYEENA